MTAARSRAGRNAHDIPLEHARAHVGVNHDDDGDEIFHDVLCATQPRASPSVAPVRRDAFREVMRRSAWEKERATLNTLAIPRERLAVFFLSILLRYTAGMKWRAKMRK